MTLTGFCFQNIASIIKKHAKNAKLKPIGPSSINFSCMISKTSPMPRKTKFSLSFFIFFSFTFFDQSLSFDPKLSFLLVALRTKNDNRIQTNMDIRNTPNSKSGIVLFMNNNVKIIISTINSTKRLIHISFFTFIYKPTPFK